MKILYSDRDQKLIDDSMEEIAEVYKGVYQANLLSIPKSVACRERRAHELTLENAMYQYAINRAITVKASALPKYFIPNEEIEITGDLKCLDSRKGLSNPVTKIQQNEV